MTDKWLGFNNLIEGAMDEADGFYVLASEIAALEGKKDRGDNLTTFIHLKGGERVQVLGSAFHHLKDLRKALGEEI